jgi:hypothetical protein
MCLNVSEMPLSVLNMKFDIIRTKKWKSRIWKVTYYCFGAKYVNVFKLLMHFEIKLIWFVDLVCVLKIIKIIIMRSSIGRSIVLVFRVDIIFVRRSKVNWMKNTFKSFSCFNNSVKNLLTVLSCFLHCKVFWCLRVWVDAVSTLIDMKAIEHFKQLVKHHFNRRNYKFGLLWILF